MDSLEDLIMHIEKLAASFGLTMSSPFEIVTLNISTTESAAIRLYIIILIHMILQLLSPSGGDSLKA